MRAEMSMMHADPIAPVILGVTTILAFAVLGRLGARKLRQPTVLGELLMGILLGNVGYWLGLDLIVVLREGPRVFDLVGEIVTGVPVEEAAIALFGVDTGTELTAILTGPTGADVMHIAQSVDLFSRYGIIFLLFMVGLSTDVNEMRSVGADSIRVALIGVFAPVLLGLGAGYLLQPGVSFGAHMFVAATLAATSIGISADVLKEMGCLDRKEARVILGAAVGDDVLGLVLLAIVSGIVVSGSINIPQVTLIIALSAAFIVGAFLAGPHIVRFAARAMAKLDIVEAKMFTSYLFVMVLAWMANLVGLATIIGAFAAGVILRDSFFERQNGGGNGRVLTIRELIMPLEVVLVPIFFILMGMQVKLESLTSPEVLYLAGGLLVAATIGKLIAGLGMKEPANQLMVGIGMLPRGEVGLVFAAIGRTLGVIDDAVFSAIVLMVMLTTLAAPSWLKWTIASERSRSRGPDDTA